MIVVLVLLGILLPIPCVQAGTVVSGSVSGVWDVAGSPYWVEGDLLVQTGTGLILDPGVEVRFRGPYRLLVNGTLQAVATPSDSILFTWDQPLPSMEWRGIRLVGADAATRIEYCRIEHVRSATSFPDVRGGAIYCESCSPSIRFCLLANNVSRNANANGMGGGVAAVGASPLVERCVMRDNEADSGGGFASIEEGSAIVRHNVIASNTAYNGGGGVYAGVRSSPVLENNVITDNRSYGWGGGGITLWNWYAVNHISKTVRNNVVARNWTSSVGGGFYIRYDYSVLENNTVADNTASSRGGGVYVLNQGPGDFPPYLHNFIVWGNTAGSDPSIHLDPATGSAVTVVYSDVEGGWPGAGNIELDPDFAGAAYNLEPASPCVDAGDPDPAYDDACFPPSHGTARNDMGAYGGPLGCGWAPEPAAIEPDRGLATPPAFFSLSVAPNPFRFATRISYSLPGAGPASLEIVDALGRRVRRLGGAAIAAETGTRDASWDGTDDSGRRLGSGVYFCRLEAVGKALTRKVAVLK